MVNTCQKFAAHKNLKFSTNPDPEKSKTKCIIFTKKEHEKLNVAPIMLNGDPLPWVGRVKHLGNILESSNLMNQDCSVKKGAFVGKINSLRQEFHSVDPEVQVNILNIYATSFYGSGLWDIFGSGCEGFYTACTGLSGRSLTCHGPHTAIGLKLSLTPFTPRSCSALGMRSFTSL